MLTLTKEERNGSIVYNAKGDLIADDFLVTDLAAGNGLATAELIFEADGSVTGPLGPVTHWVDIDGSDDIPVNPAAWDGVSAYTMSWEIMSYSLSGGGNHTPAGIVGATGTGWTSFTSYVSGGSIHSTVYNVTITKAPPNQATFAVYQVTVVATSEP